MVSKPVSGLLTIRELGFVLRARLSAPIRDYLEFPDIILTAHDFLEGRAAPIDLRLIEKNGAPAWSSASLD